MIIFSIICGIVSIVIGMKDAERSLIVSEFGMMAYIGLNGVAGYLFGTALVTFFSNIGKVMEIAGAFAKWFVASAVSLMITGAYLTLQFYRIYMN